MRATISNIGLVATLLGGVLTPRCAAALRDAAAWTRLSSTTGELPVPNDGSQQTCCVVADLDGDGRTDFVIGERTRTPSVVWYRPRGEAWDRLVIDDTPLQPEAGGEVCDIDGDGDLDLILGQDASGSAIWWWENPRPDFDRPWTRRLIKQGGGNKHHDQTVGDFDGDGRPEIVSWNQGAKQLLLLEIPANPRDDQWRAAVIYQWHSGEEHEGFPSIPVDIDLDGQLDIVGGGRWLKHTGGTSFQPQLIDERMRFTQCAAGQLVKGGRPEVVFSPGDADGQATWYQWSDGQWKGQSLGAVIHGHTCEVRDVDADGNLDVFIGEMGTPGAGDQAKTWIWYGDGRGGFTQTLVSRGQGIHEGKLADLDGDGDLDILMKPYHHNAPRIDVLLQPGKPGRAQ